MNSRFRFIITIVVGGVIFLLVVGVVAILINLATNRHANVAGISTSYDIYTSTDINISRLPSPTGKIDYNFKLSQ